eukprot:176831_1
MDKNSIRVERESQWKSRRNAPRKPQNPVANGASTERSQLVGKLAEIEKQMSKLGNERMRLREQLSKLDAKGPEPQPSRQPVPKSSSREVASPNPSVQMLERRGSLDRGKGVNAALEMELFGEKRLNPAAIDFSEYEAIPVHVTGDHIPKPVEDFASVDNLHPQLGWNIARAGFTRPTPVQKHALPLAVAGRDIVACAQTGSGKTAAFIIPMIQQLLETGGGARKMTNGRAAGKSFARFAPVGLILSPTRELAIQIHDEARKMLYRTGMRTCTVYGGAKDTGQLRALAPLVDLLVATPGRLIDFLKRGCIVLEKIRFLVLDEADRMLDMGFEPQVREIVQRHDMPGAGSTRQTLMFSATFAHEVQLLAQAFLSPGYAFIAVGRVGSTTHLIEQRVERAEKHEKRERIMELLAEHSERTLVFTRTKHMAKKLSKWIHAEVDASTSIHGNRSQSQREHALKEFREGRARVLVATDVASRGLDVPGVKYVVNYDMPAKIDDYVHRIGRTGRCGQKGIAISFVAEDDSGILRPLHALLLECDQPVPDWLARMAVAPGGGGGGHGKRFGGRDVRKGGGRQQQSGGGRQQQSGGGRQQQSGGGRQQQFGGGRQQQSGGGRQQQSG